MKTVYGTETAGYVVDRCSQIFDDVGLSKELPLGRWYGERRIGEDPSVVHRTVVVRKGVI